MIREDIAEKVLENLNKKGVKYVLIGAATFAHYGYLRYTYDIDILIENTKDNIKKCISALDESGCCLKDTDEEEFARKKILIRNFIISIDIHPSVLGTDFESIWKTREEGKFGKVKVFMPSIEEIIKMKAAAARPKDVEDLKYLKEIKKQTRRKAKKRDEKK
ncbi:MAG: DUF6036 family nucleotidyltransferase [bacterium]